MIIFRKSFLVFVLILLVKSVTAQEYGPKPVKPFDVKIIKGKTLFIPEYDEKVGFVKTFIPREAFKEFKSEKEIAYEFKKRWDSAIKISTFDFAPHEIKWFDRKKLERDRDKTVMCLYYESDFYNNWYAYLQVMDPKPTDVACALVNDLDFSNINDVKLMFNMLVYSMIKGCSYYGDDAKGLYKEHQYKYKKVMESFSDSIRYRVLLVPKFDKERKDFKKYNEKLNEYLKLNWKISNFDFLTQLEIDRRVAAKRSSDYYIKSIPIHTANEKMTYNYFIILTAANNDIIHTYTGAMYLLPGNLKYFQIDIENWLYYFMERKKRDKYQFVSKIKEKAAATKGKTTGGKKQTPKTQAPKTKQTAPPKIQQTTKTKAETPKIEADTVKTKSEPKKTQESKKKK
jgi:hypothetical protein